MNYFNTDAYSRPIEGARIDLPAVMRQVYTWMFLGLLVTAGVAAVIGSQRGLVTSLLTGSGIVLVFGLFFVELGVVWYLSARIMKMEPTTAKALFIAYSALNGVTLSFIFLYYQVPTIAAAFIATAGMFGVTSVLAYTTKTDLSKMGGILMMALIGLIIASIVNIFFSSSLLFTVINYAGVLIFVGLTAYDTQKIKNMAMNVDMLAANPTVTNGQLTAATASTDVMVQRVAIIGALRLYLDFVNLFLFILRILGAGSRR